MYRRTLGCGLLFRGSGCVTGFLPMVGDLVAYLRGAMSLRPVTEHLCLRWRAAFASQQIVTLAFGAKHIPFGMLFIANDFCIPVIYIG
jgi:hypothetical protein